MRVLFSTLPLYQSIQNKKVSSCKSPNLNLNSDIFVKSHKISFTSNIVHINKNFVAGLIPAAIKLGAKPEDYPHINEILLSGKKRYVEKIADFFNKVGVKEYNYDTVSSMFDTINPKNERYLDFIAEHAKDLEKSAGFKNDEPFKWAVIFKSLRPENEECLQHIAKNPQAFNMVGWHVGHILNCVVSNCRQHKIDKLINPQNIKARIKLIRDVSEGKISLKDLNIKHGNDFASYVLESITKDNVHHFTKENIPKILEFMNHFEVLYKSRAYGIMKHVTPRNEYCLEVLKNVKVETPEFDEYKRFLLLEGLVKHANPITRPLITRMAKEGKTLEQIASKMRFEISNKNENYQNWYQALINRD